MTLPNHNNLNPRWFALVNDTIVPAPQKLVKVSLLKTLASIPEGSDILRDYQSNHDESFDGESEIDLAKGNVFRVVEKLPKRKVKPEKAPSKKAFAVDDRFEIVTIPEMTLETLMELFNLEKETVLRDYESPFDDPIEDDYLIKFEDGPTFITRNACLKITIIVNGRERSVDKRFLSYEEVVSLAFENPNFDKVAYTVTYKKGPQCNKEGVLNKGQRVRIKKGMVFNVTNTDKS